MNNATLNDLIFGAFRYALGRRTYYVGTVVNIILDNWGDLTSNLRFLIIKEIEAAIQDDKAGDEMDIYEWKKILRRGEV